ncbi:helicase [Corynebacterium sp. 13CS0277]|uniref:metal ABC transporter permease n=1 Tax=Corynebacterium sp. 13CS0277 TaxID=2071994 RepID=UPI000D03C7BF|nr:metal ABC transporter permease [Corynebacterium sp. 13CS0277]PRQ11512.1 helicase [Corynebacterium sp. 13CS0277]
MLSSSVELLHYDFVQHALIAAAFLGLVSGVMAPMIVLRSMSFAVHGTSELALMGAAAALLVGVNVGAGAVVGSVVAAVVLAVLGFRRQDAAVGVVMSFGMGLSVLFIHLYPGRSSTAFALLTGQIVGVTGSSVAVLGGISLAVSATVAVLWRPLLFASADPMMAAAMGVKVRALSVVFAILVGLTAAMSVQIVGALLVMALLITPGAAAVAVTNRPGVAVALSVLFAEIAACGGLVLSLGPGLPVSVFVTALSFGIYVACRAIAGVAGGRIR